MIIRERLEYFIPDEKFEETILALNAIPCHKKAVLIDLDGVLLEADSDHSKPDKDDVDYEIRQKVSEIDNNYNVIIATNRTRYDHFDLEGIEQIFSVPVLDNESMKPDPGFFEEGLKEVNATPEETVYIGDSPLMDVYGGNRAGLTTYQVEHDRSEYKFPLSFTKRGEDMLQNIVGHFFAE